MKILIAPDSFKESLSAPEVANAIKSGFLDVFPDAEYELVPVADGGEGTVESMVSATQGNFHHSTVTGPLGTPVKARWGTSGDEVYAFIEMAAASGLALVPSEKRNPLYTTSFGTGELIKNALDIGIKNFVIGIGGSATNDGGVGMMQALGVKFLDKNDEPVGAGGEQLLRIKKIDTSMMDARLSECTFQIACDVTNPLTGPEGAAAVFGPQKGATDEIINILDDALNNYANILYKYYKKDIKTFPGAGAAGGLGISLLLFCNGVIKPGIEIVTEALQLDMKMKDADLVITGEGRIDSQTLQGKVPVGIAAMAKKFNIPVIGIAGTVTADFFDLQRGNINTAFSIISQLCSLSQAFEEAEVNLVNTSRNIAESIRIGLLIERDIH